MENCTYRFANSDHVFNSYTELLEHIDDLIANHGLLLDNYSDLVFSNDPYRLDQEKAINDNKIKLPKTGIDDAYSRLNSEVNGGMTNSLSVIRFMEALTYDGHTLITPFDETTRGSIREDYIKKCIDNGADRKEVEDMLETMSKLWPGITDDLVLIHEIINSDNLHSEDRQALNKEFNEKIRSRVRSTKGIVHGREVLMASFTAGLVNDLLNKVKAFYNSEKNKHSEATAFYNINFSAPVIGSNERVNAHIDYILIDPDGTMYCYVFKTTLVDPANWLLFKEQRYCQQLAFIKAIMKSNGLNVENVHLNVVPILIKYDPSYTRIESTLVYTGNGIRQYSTSSNGLYKLYNLDRLARMFIDTGTPKFVVTLPNLKRADEIIDAIFPDLNITLNGIAESARILIERAPLVEDNMAPMTIKKVGDPGHAYDVTINGETYAIADGKKPTRNPEILLLVKDNIADIAKNRNYATKAIRSALDASFKNGTPMFFPRQRRFRLSATHMLSVFNRYIPEFNPETKRVEGEWEMLDDLEDYNILLFKHKDGTLDVVSLTPFNINAKIRFSKGDNILGSYLTSLQYNSLAGNYGNVEAVRVMTLLNQIIANHDDVKLGTMKIVSAIGLSDFMSYDIGEFNRRYYTEIINHILSLQPGLGQIKNNFQNAEFVDPCVAVLDEYNKIINGHDRFHNAEEYKKQYEAFGFLLLMAEGLSLHQKLNGLMNILVNILNAFPDFGKPLDVITAMADKSNRLRHDMAILYDMVTKAYLSLSGGTPDRATDWDVIRGNFVNPFGLADNNVRYAVENLQHTFDKIADEFFSIYDKNIRNIFSEYYKEIGYTQAENMIVGSLAHVYRNLIDPDSEIMSFKNPYDYSNDLNTSERKLLKKVLLQLAYIRTAGEFKLNIHDDAAMRNYILANESYLWVPLERASKATIRTSRAAMKKSMQNKMRRWWNIAERFQENVLGVTREEMALVGDDTNDFYKLSLHNKFDTNMPIDDDITDTYQARKKMILKYGREFFEINLENIAIDYLFSQISTRLLNKYIIGTKALLLLLHLTGDYGGNQETVKKEVEYILKYLKANVFHVPIVSKTELGIMSFLAPFRKFATKMLICGNLVGMMRDTLTGVEQSFIRSAIKLNTDIDAKNLAKAHAYVTRHATSNAMAINMLSKLCLKYRLAGSDISRIPERTKTGRNGIFNYDNWMFGTMRTPDFMNRMALFVARCMHDGVWDAFSIDENNNLVYDWKKDARFEAYAAGRTSDPKYNEQKALYLSKIREYNIEHPDLVDIGQELKMGDDLPTPYSDAEVRNIQALGDNLYGAYDRSKRAMIENASFGWTFTMFFAWMGGIINNYFAAPHRGAMGKLVALQEIDESGRPLFFNSDGTITTENTGLKVYKNIPVIVQGVLPTVLDLVRVVSNDGMGGFRSYLRENALARAVMYKVLSDGLMWMLMAILFKFAFDDAYKEYKADEMADNPLILNIVVEALYKGSNRACDLFKGPFTVFNYFFDNLNSPLVSVPVRTVNDTLNWLSGNKSAMKFFSSLSGFIRPILDSVRAEWRKYGD